MYQFALPTANSVHEAPLLLESEWFETQELIRGFEEIQSGGFGDFFGTPAHNLPVETSTNEIQEEDFITTLSRDPDPFSMFMESMNTQYVAPKDPQVVMFSYQPRIVKENRQPRAEKNDNSKRNRSIADSAMTEVSSTAPKKTKGNRMEPFPDHRVVHWKYVLYNLLVENYNSDDKNTLAVPCEVSKNGKSLQGFTLNQALDPKKRLAELYSLYVRKEDITTEDYSSPFVQDLYKYYLRCALQLMTKFFVKAGPWTYLYDDVTLFIPDEDLNSAEMRLRFLEGKKKRKGE